MTAVATRPKKPATPAQNPGEGDPTQRFAAKFNDPSQWKIVSDVPIFDEHEEEHVDNVAGPDGKPVQQKRIERFSVAELQAHADKCNALVESGNPPGITFGHTLDKAPEGQQPETAGFGKNFRVRFHPPLNRHVVSYDEWYMPERYEEAKTYPYRSVERWRSGGYFKPIALLRREPRRNLGVVMAYQAPGGADQIIRYSMDYASMPNQPPPPAGGPPAAAAPAPAPAPAAAPAAPAPPLEPSDQDKQLFAKLITQYMSNPENCKAMYAAMSVQPPAGAAPAAGASPAPSPVPPMPGGSPPEKMAAGVPSGTNTVLPALNPQKEPQPMSADTITVERYQADVARYQAELDGLRKERERDSLRIAELEKGERVARYAGKLRYMEEVEGYQIDSAEELERCQDYSQEEFDQHVKDIERYGAGNRRPVGGPIRPDGSPHPRMAGGDKPKMDREQYDAAMQWLSENPGKTWPEAMRYAMNGQPVR